MCSLLSLCEKIIYMLTYALFSAHKAINFVGVFFCLRRQCLHNVTPCPRQPTRRFAFICNLPVANNRLVSGHAGDACDCRQLTATGMFKHSIASQLQCQIVIQNSCCLVVYRCSPSSRSSRPQVQSCLEQKDKSIQVGDSLVFMRLL